MEILQTMYNLLHVNRKIEDMHIRYVYLKDVWGMEQQLIADCEGISQSYVSRELIKARNTIPQNEFVEATSNLWTAAEIQYIQMLPREIIMDLPVLAFIENILGLHPYHPFFQFHDTGVNLRIAALASMGIQHKRIEVLFSKKQPVVSMAVKRSLKRALEIERPNRYDKSPKYTFSNIPTQTKFLKAGGQQL